MRLIYLLLFTAVISFCISCNDQPTCIPEQSDILKISFVDVIGNPSEITLNSLTVENSNESFPIITDSTNTAFSIPLNPLDSNVVIRFEQDTVTHYLALGYSTSLVVLNPQCYLETRFNLLEIDSTDFINVFIREPLLSPETPKNIEIIHNDPPPCIPEQTDIMKTTFVDESGNVSDISFNTFLINDIIMMNDSLFSTLDVPLNPDDSLIRYTFYRESDTVGIELRYDTTEIDSNPTCGQEIKFNILNIESSSFENASIVDSLLSLETTQNIEIIR